MTRFLKCKTSKCIALCFACFLSAIERLSVVSCSIFPQFTFGGFFMIVALFGGGEPYAFKGKALVFLSGVGRRWCRSCRILSFKEGRTPVY